MRLEMSESSRDFQPVDLHTDRPHPARVYDYLLVVSLPRWRPDHGAEVGLAGLPSDAAVSVFGGVARKP